MTKESKLWILFVCHWSTQIVLEIVLRFYYCVNVNQIFLLKAIQIFLYVSDRDIDIRVVTRKIGRFVSARNFQFPDVNFVILENGCGTELEGGCSDRDETGEWKKTFVTIWSVWFLFFLHLYSNIIFKNIFFFGNLRMERNLRIRPKMRHSNLTLLP